MTTPYEKIKEDYDALVAEYKTSIADGTISLTEGLSLLLHGTLSIVYLLQDYTALTDDQRRATAIDLVSQFYKDVIEPLQLGPSLLDSYIDKSLEALIPTFVGTLYDSVNAFLKKVL